MKLVFSTLTLLIVATLSPQAAIAQNSHSAALKKFATPDVLGVAYLDLDNMDLKESMKLLGSLGFDETVNYRKMQEELSETEGNIATLKEAGITRGYALLRMSDISAHGTSFVFPLKEGADSAKSKQVLDSVIEKLTGGKNKGFHFQTGFRDGALFAAEKENFDRLKNEIADDSADRSDMLQAIDGGSMGIVIFGDDDSRRVVKEMMPPLPGPFAKLNGELIADGAKWIGLSAKLDSSPALNFEIEANDAESAATFQSVIKDGLKLAKFAPQVREVLPKSEVKFVFDAIAPEQEGTRVSMSASKLTEDLDRLAKVLAPQVKMARKAAVKTQLMNTLRQHILAMLNYESAYRHFPAQYSVDAAGKPLLSWRVHILPFLEQNDLYQQFKLDEPWDSEHNIKLVKKMPEIYWDMRGEAFDRNKAGKTIFQVPAGEKLIFNADKEIQFRDLTDGSSNTISIVVVASENAVPWTKPVDWKVDLEDSTNGVIRKSDTIIFAMCDGSVQSVPKDFSPDKFKNLIQPQDGVAVEW